MTGGFGKSVSRVSLYNQQGFVKDLASLSTGRYDHACGFFRDNNGDTVSNTNYRILENITYLIKK